MIKHAWEEGQALRERLVKTQRKWTLRGGQPEGYKLAEIFGHFVDDAPRMCARDRAGRDMCARVGARCGSGLNVLTVALGRRAGYTTAVRQLASARSDLNIGYVGPNSIMHSTHFLGSERQNLHFSSLGRQPHDWCQRFRGRDLDVVIFEVCTRQLLDFDVGHARVMTDRVIMCPGDLHGESRLDSDVVVESLTSSMDTAFARALAEHYDQLGL